MDAQLKFYNQNRLLFRFLLFFTLLFVVMLSLLLWFGRNSAVPVVVEETVIKKFSQYASPAEATKVYEYGAKYIHDIEAYPTIKDLFFSQPILPLVEEEEFKLALEEVYLARQNGTDFGSIHVYNTSYYIGNLLVLPDLALHTLLLSKSRPYTTNLLEMALADVRSGVIKIQNYFDVAPPTFYNASSSGLLYFPTPSFPSLTVTEVATVLNVLANIDPVHARFYEAQLKQFASQTFATGANFKVDIEFALKLAENYISIMKTIPAYQELFAEAKTEWEEIMVVDTTATAPELIYDFRLDDFPYESALTILPDKESTYSPLYPNEDLDGELKLSLVDERLPKPVLRMYEYDFKHNDLLPFGIDLQPRKFPQLASSFGLSRYIDQDTYLFFSGDYSGGIEAKAGFKNPQALLRDQDQMWNLELLKDNQSSNLEQIVLAKDGTTIFFTTAEINSETGLKEQIINKTTLSGNRVVDVERLGVGSSPSLVGTSTLIFVRNGEIFQLDLLTKNETILPGINPVTVDLLERKISYFNEQAVLLVVDTFIDRQSLIPTTKVFLYTLRGSEATHLYQATFSDLVVADTKLSPAGRYLALVATETLSRHSPKLLIFDIMNGIIKKEVDLSSFSPRSLFIDEWTFF